MLLRVVVDEARDGVVVAARHHARRGGLALELLLVLGLVGRVG